MGSVAPGDTPIETITLADNGPSDADGVTVSDLFNADVASLGEESSSADAVFERSWRRRIPVDRCRRGRGFQCDVRLGGVGAVFARSRKRFRQPGVRGDESRGDRHQPGRLRHRLRCRDRVGLGRVLGVAIASYDGDGVGTATSESALAGTDITYQVTVSNATAVAQTDLVVPVSMPSAFTLDSGVVASTGHSATGDVLTWSIPSLGAGASDDPDLHRDDGRPGRHGVRHDHGVGDQRPEPSWPDRVGIGRRRSGVGSLGGGERQHGSVYAGARTPTRSRSPTTARPPRPMRRCPTRSVTGSVPSSRSARSAGRASRVSVDNAYAWTGITLPSGASATFELMGALPTTLVAGGAFTDLASASLPPGQASPAAPRPPSTRTR